MNMAMLIPSYDMLGLPAPPMIIQLLMALTLALHWLFLGGAVGGTLLVLITAIKGETNDESVKEVHKNFVPQLPFFLALAMTMGVAPLLFVQVLYGNLFYTANILQAFWWLGLVPIVISIFYLLYYSWYELRNKGQVHWKTPAVTFALFVLCAVILSSNATLLETPTAWQSMRLPFQGVKLYHGDSTLLARLLMALTGMLSLGGLYYGLIPRLKSAISEEALAGALSRGLSIALPAAVVYGCANLLFLFSLPEVIKKTLLAGSGEALLFYVTAIILIGAIVALFVAFKGGKSSIAIGGLVLFFLHLFSLAAVRDYIRRLKIDEFFQVAKVPVNPQWDSFILWALVFVAGLAVVAYMVKLTMKESN